MKNKNVYGKHLIKMLKLVDLLCDKGGKTIDELQAELSLSDRTIHRLFRTLEELNFPIYDDPHADGKKSRYSLMEGYLEKLPNRHIPNINFTIQEVIALYLLRGEGRLYKGTGMETSLNSVFVKLSAFVPESFEIKIEKIKALFATSAKFAKDYSGKEGIIDELTDAMLTYSTCHVVYHSFHHDKVKEYDIESLSFFESNGGLYLYARITGYEDIRTLAVERIVKLKRSNNTFEPPEKFDPEEKLENVFDLTHDEPIEVKVWFSKDQARYIKERRWANTQKIIDQEDGSIIFEMTTSGWWDIKSWIMKYGADAKVLEPEEMRKEIVGELEMMRARYNK